MRENTSIESLENKVLHKPYISNMGWHVNSDKAPSKQKKHKSKQDLNQHITSGLIKQIEKEIQNDYRNYTNWQISEERKIELIKEARKNL